MAAWDRPTPSPAGCPAGARRLTCRSPGHFLLLPCPASSCGLRVFSRLRSSRLCELRQAAELLCVHYHSLPHPALKLGTLAGAELFVNAPALPSRPSGWRVHSRRTEMAPTSMLLQGKAALRTPAGALRGRMQPQRLQLHSKLSSGRRGCAQQLGRGYSPGFAGGGGAGLAAQLGPAHPRGPQPPRRVLRGCARGAGPGFRFLANSTARGKPRSFREPRRER